MQLENLVSAIELRGTAARKSKSEDFHSVRNQLVEEEKAKGWQVAKKPGKTTTRLKRPKSLDRLLEDRVWSLMYRMGFTHLSDEGGAFQLLSATDPKTPQNQIDVVALDADVAVAIECKSCGQPRKFGDFSKELAKHVSLREGFTRAVRSQFPQSYKRPSLFMFWTQGIVVTAHDRKRAEEVGVQLLDEQDLDYYEHLVEQIGKASRYQFLADILEGRQVPGLELTVPAIRTKFGKAYAYTFSISPAYLLKIAFVSHRARGKASDIDAYQRMLKKSRLRQIREYIDEGGMFPTNIVVNIAQSRWLNFDRGKQEGDEGLSTFGWLHIRPAYRVAWIIDGQHRLFAYADAERADKSVISVMAFVGLPASEQARLFVDINAEQRKVKQSLLQELYAELHWDASDPETRVQAILSKVVQALDTELGSPFRDRILKADDVRTDTRCISLTSVFRALERTGFFVAKTKRGEVLEYGPLWNVENERTVKRTVHVLIAYFSEIREEVPALWDAGAGEGGGLAMNDGTTVCINVLRSVLYHLQEVKRVPLSDMSDDEIGEVVEPYAKQVGRYFASLTPDHMVQFRALRGVQGQTAGTRRLEEAIRRSETVFNPPGLSEFLEREKAQTTTHAFQAIQNIEHVLQRLVLGELKREFGQEEREWFFNGVPKAVRKKIDDRINDEAGKKGGREENLDLIDYREIIDHTWPLFESTLARGKGSRDARTKWIVEVNELRKPVMHASKGKSLPITEEQLAFLEEIQSWLLARSNQDEVIADSDPHLT